MKHVSLGGYRLHYVDQGSGSQVLLLVHGFPLDHTMWREQLDGLSDSYRVIAPDLRGFGRNEEVEGKLTMEQLADDLAKLLEQLGIENPVALCGLSMGGYIAWQFWQRHAERLSHLILCDTRAAADTAQAAGQRLKAAKLVLEAGSAVLVPTMLPKLLAGKTVQDQPELVAELGDVMRNTSPQTIAAAQRGMAERADMSGRLSSVEVPTLVLCGHEDVITPAAEMSEMAQSMPNALFERVKQAGHMAPLERPDVVNRAIRQFLVG